MVVHISYQFMYDTDNSTCVFPETLPYKPEQGEYVKDLFNHTIYKINKVIYTGGDCLHLILEN